MFRSSARSKVANTPPISLIRSLSFYHTLTERPSVGAAPSVPGCIMLTYGRPARLDGQADTGPAELRIEEGRSVSVAEGQIATLPSFGNE
jgi:hypothetical protein